MEPEKELERVSESVWRERFAAFESSGLSKAKFCASNAINKSTFYSWYGRLHGKSSRIRRGRPRFSKVAITSSGAVRSCEVRIQLPRGIEIQSSSYPDPIWVVGMMKALGERGES